MADVASGGGTIRLDRAIPQLETSKSSSKLRIAGRHQPGEIAVDDGHRWCEAEQRIEAVHRPVRRRRSASAIAIRAGLLRRRGGGRSPPCASFSAAASISRACGKSSG